MKRIMLIGLLISSVSLFGVDHGLISGFEVGYNFNKSILVESGNCRLFEGLSNSLYVQLKTGYRVENFRFIGTYTNTMFPLEFDRFSPVQDRFKVEINYTWENITIGLFHWCDHPVITQDDERTTSVNMSQRSLYIRGYWEF